MRSLLSGFRRELSGAVVGVGVALLYSAALRALTSDRLWLVGLLLLGVAVLVLGGCVVLLRREVPEPETEPVDLPGAVRDRSRPARSGPRTPIHEVVRHEPREYPVVDPNATTVRGLPSAAEVTAYIRAQADQTAVLPKAGGRAS